MLRFLVVPAVVSATNVNLAIQSEAGVAAFDKFYETAVKEFDGQQYASFVKKFKRDLARYVESDAFKAVPAEGHCDKGANPSPVMLSAMDVKSASAFPGGALKKLFGFDLTKMIFDLTQKASGAANASGGMVAALAMQALMMGAAQVQNVVSNAIHIIPPMIPPPVWTNQPLSCVPMVTGHNCFGAVLHPITMADFVIADVTDASLDGIIAAFPKLYASKVGKTSDIAYKACYSSYMSMHCGSLFPRCQAPAGPTSREEMRLPLCFTSCIATLVACPGFWIDDVINQCQDVSVPPMCSMAAFWNVGSVPPQYVTFEDSHRASTSCPATLSGPGSLDAGSEIDLFETPSIAGATGGAAKLPLA